jgi:hypothetical protein
LGVVVVVVVVGERCQVVAAEGGVVRVDRDRRGSS